MKIQRYTINLSSKKSSTDLYDTVDAFYDLVIPTAFKWLGWALMLGALRQIADVTDSKTLGILVLTLSIGFIGHVGYLFFRINIIWGDEEVKPGRRFRKREKAVSIAVIMVIYFGFFFVANEANNAISEFQSALANAKQQSF